MRTPPNVARCLPREFHLGLLWLGLIGAAASASAADWPQWRGPFRNGHAAPDAPPVTALPAEVKPLWKKAVGGGFSAPVIAGNRLVYLDEDGTNEVAHLLDAATGAERWRTVLTAAYKDEWGTGPRATPLIDEDRVYVQACNGEFRCLSLADGRVIWGTSFEQDFGVKFLGYKAREGTAARRGNSGSGVIDGERLILPVGSTDGAGLVCFNKRDGRVLWKAGQDEAAYASLFIAPLAGVKQVLAFNAEALLGAEVDTGKILWRVPLRTDAKRHAATPVVFGDRVVVNSHTIGMVCFEISRDSGGFTAKPAWTNKDLRINIATAVLVDGALYSQGANQDYVCVDAATGALKWAQSGFGGGREAYASTIVVGKNLLIQTFTGELVLAAAAPAKYTELDRLQVCGKSWSHPAYADGRLYVRDGRQLFCLPLATAASAP